MTAFRQRHSRCGEGGTVLFRQVGQQDSLFGFRETSRQRMKPSMCVSAVSALLTKCYCTLQGPVNNYSRGEAKRDVVVCYCIHLGRKRHGSQLMNQLEQGIEVSIGARKPGLLELAIMLCSYVLSLYPFGERGGEYLIVSCKMEQFLAEGLKKKPYNLLQHCSSLFPVQSKLPSCEKTNLFEFFPKEVLKLLSCF